MDPNEWVLLSLAKILMEGINIYLNYCLHLMHYFYSLINSFIAFILPGHTWEEQSEAEDVLCIDWDG